MFHIDTFCVCVFVPFERNREGECVLVPIKKLLEWESETERTCMSVHASVGLFLARSSASQLKPH